MTFTLTQQRRASYEGQHWKTGLGRRGRLVWEMGGSGASLTIPHPQAAAGPSYKGLPGNAALWNQADWVERAKELSLYLREVLSFPLRTNMMLLTSACLGQSPKPVTVPPHTLTWLDVPPAHKSHKEVMHVTCRQRANIVPSDHQSRDPMPMEL